MCYRKEKWLYAFLKEKQQNSGRLQKLPTAKKIINIKRAGIIAESHS